MTSKKTTYHFGTCCAFTFLYLEKNAGFIFIFINLIIFKH